jgi:hypothetical protein
MNMKAILKEDGWALRLMRSLCKRLTILQIHAWENIRSGLKVANQARNIMLGKTKMYNKEKCGIEWM